jgi:hypothetical protein
MSLFGFAPELKKHQAPHTLRFSRRNVGRTATLEPSRLSINGPMLRGRRHNEVRGAGAGTASPARVLLSCTAVVAASTCLLVGATRPVHAVPVVAFARKLAPAWLRLDLAAHGAGHCVLAWGLCASGAVGRGAAFATSATASAAIEALQATRLAPGRAAMADDFFAGVCGAVVGVAGRGQQWRAVWPWRGAAPEDVTGETGDCDSTEEGDVLV